MRSSWAIVFLACASAVFAAGDGARRPATAQEERYWLENMVQEHRFSLEEVIAATGMTEQEAKAAIARHQLTAAPTPRQSGTPLKVLPYPGGRHPRIGFLDGAILPQRETKISVFTPWDPASYVVVDVPEAIFSNLGLTYLAHTHIPTLWTEKKIELPPLEWKREPNGILESERVLPNGIVFGARVEPRPEAVLMELWLRNGTAETLTGLRVQNCAMLKGAPGFNQQTSTNKVFASPYAAVHDASGKRWIIMAWEGCQRAWGNVDVPCIHSDPKFPDCRPGEVVRVAGRLSFYEGQDLTAEFARIEKTGWRATRKSQE